MTEIVLVRHGETDWNVGEVFRGRADIALNPTGHRQAELLAEHLSFPPVDAVYSSPLQRALDTAGPVARYHQLEVSVAAGLVDIDYGEWQGLSRREVEAKYPQLYREWLAHPERLVLPGGESLADVRRRAMTVVEEAVARPGRVVLVAHRAVNKVLICALLGLDDSHFWEIRQDNGGITVFAAEGGRYILTGHNDTSHLKALGKPPPADF